MAIRSSFFNSVNGDRRYLANNFAEYFASFIANGVFPNPSNGLQVYEKQNMTVIVKPGKGWINGYFAVNEYDYELTFDNADGLLNRIDRVVLRLDFTNRAIDIAVKKGLFASSPVAVNVQRDADAYEIVLADVYIAKGSTSISQSNITDQRLNTALCGIVHSLVNQVDTTTIFNQFESWLETVQNTLSGDVAGNLLNQINFLKNELDAHKTGTNVHGIGDKTTLATTEKSTIVEAINEVKTTVDSKSVVIDRFTDAGTFTWIKPKGVKKVIVSLCGGGGGGTAYVYSGVWTNINGKAGGVSSFGGYVSASGGTGTGAALADNPITSYWLNGTSYKFGGGAEGFTSYIGTAVQGYGYGGKGSYYNNGGTGYYGAGGGGAQSIINQSVILDSTVNTVLITIGAGGAGGSSGSTSGDAGKNGCVIVEYLL